MYDKHVDVNRFKIEELFLRARRVAIGQNSAV